MSWTTVFAAVRAKLEAQAGINADQVFDGRQAVENYPDEIYVLMARPRTREARANNLVLRGYPVLVEYRGTITDDDGKDQRDMATAAEDLVLSLFDGKTPADFPTLSGLEESSVVTQTLDDRPPNDDVSDEIRARFLVTFPMWEAA